MTTKRLILSLLAVFTITPLTWAQNSAQATMKVQVRVVEGNGISAQHQKTFSLQSRDGQAGDIEIATLKRHGSLLSSVAVEQPRALTLVDEEGREVQLPLQNSSKELTGQLLSRVSLPALNTAEVPGKLYRGSYTTTIAYL